MNVYEVNKPFPFPHPFPGSEVTLSDITDSLFDVKCYMQDPQPGEIKDWRKGSVKVALYQYDNCPFFIVKFDTWSLDVSINLLKVKSEEQQEDWLNREGNIINLFLIDSRTNIIKAMRTISVNFADQIRDVLEQQLQQYTDHHAVEKRIAEVQHSLSTEEMLSRAKAFQKF